VRGRRKGGEGAHLIYFSGSNRPAEGREATGKGEEEDEVGKKKRRESRSLFLGPAGAKRRIKKIVSVEYRRRGLPEKEEEGGRL